MATTLDSLQAEMDDVLQRLAVLDGEGLVSPLQGFTAQTSARITGLKNDVQGTALSLEALIRDLTVLVNSLQSSVNQLMTLSGTVPTGGSSDGDGFVTPPVT